MRPRTKDASHTFAAFQRSKAMQPKVAGVPQVRCCCTCQIVVYPPFDSSNKNSNKNSNNSSRITAAEGQRGGVCKYLRLKLAEILLFNCESKLMRNTRTKYLSATATLTVLKLAECNLQVKRTFRLPCRLISSTYLQRLIQLGLFFKKI